jgi:ribonuclease T
MKKFNKRFRGFYPVVIDVETGGFNSETDALLELAAVTLKMDENGLFTPNHTYSYHLEPFPNANIEKSALEFTGIDPDHPFRLAVSETKALTDLFKLINKSLNDNQCQKAVLVGHNAAFDLNFLQAAIKRCEFKTNPFHSFTAFDTASLAAIALGQTVLAKALQKANIDFDNKEAHSAIYDAQKTAELFCHIINHSPFEWPKTSSTKKQ